MKKLILSIVALSVMALPVAGHCYDRHRDYRPDYRPNYHARHHHHNHHRRDIALGLGALGIIAGTAMAMENANRYSEARPRMCTYDEPVYDRYGEVIKLRTVERPCRY